MIEVTGRAPVAIKETLRRQPLGRLIGMAMLALMICAVLVGPMLSPYGPYESVTGTLHPPTLEHPFGTDQLGRDILVRVLVAGRLDLTLAVVAVTISLLIGTAVGVIIGMGGRSKLSTGLDIVVDGVNAFPFIVIGLAVVAVVGPSVMGLLVAICGTQWAQYSRVAAKRTRVIANAEYIQAARLLGYKRIRVLARHVVPNVWSESIAYALNHLILVVLAIAALSFLGAGIRPPIPEWGAMISEGRIVLARAWWVSMMPGAALAFTGVGIQLVAESTPSKG